MDPSPSDLLDALADPGAAPAASTAAAVTSAMAAALLFMALERTTPPPFGSVAQARALRRRAEARITQATISYERARTALRDPVGDDATIPVGGTVPVLEGIFDDVAGIVALAEDVVLGVHADSQADVVAAAQLAAGAARAAETLTAANRLHPEPLAAAQLSARADELATALAARRSA